MRLLNILTFIYLLLTLGALLLGGIFIYWKLESEIDFEVGMELNEQIDAIAERVRQGVDPKALENEKMEILPIPLAWEEEELSIRDTLAFHAPVNRLQNQLKASKSLKINGNHYRFSYFNTVIEAEDITETVLYIMGLVLLAQLLAIGFFYRRIANRILLPFHHTLAKIQTFTFQKDQPLSFEPSKIQEFELLNRFLEKMSLKLLKDYRQIKEFSENISHEIQTPAAVVRGKLEHLMNQEITEEQAHLIHSAYQSNEKIQRIIKSLSLLAKLENEEFEAPVPLRLDELTQKNLDFLQELIQLREIRLEIDLKSGLTVPMHPYIAEVMITNLLSNAIKHNHQKGWMMVILRDQQLEIINSGHPLSKNTEDLLERFQKESSHPDSVGLGLAIVQQICKTYGFRFSYSTRDEVHHVVVNFG
ncbi:HAMP domain-containing sensor histidine kinase [Algoriphagus confluentis]|uniref:histidine kinase n=1 Tax=Algoriphagus confluentis TaxID=1697556 RepID=A0ABQ6PNN3_9BACT|nr:HAMP domain-containing sensor histidine kinase [Algoriphagus confluentis]